jgi:GNAT superfamily N-acetyltransferase
LESTKNDFGYAIYDPKDPEKFLGGVWVGVESFGEDNLGLEFQLGNRQAWLYCAFVDGDARGRGVYKKLLSFVAQDVRSRGFSQLLTVINPWNIVSRGAHEKQSKRICGTVSSVRFFSLARVWSSGNVHIDKRWVTQIKDRPSIITMK